MRIVAASLLFSLVFFQSIYARASAVPDTAVERWAKENLWPNDNTALPEEGTLEICRDVSDLWQATRVFNVPGLFASLLQYHGFTFLSGNASQKLFARAPAVKRVRLVLQFKRSLRDTFETAARLSINRESLASPKFKLMAELQSSDPKRFLSTCQQKFDGFWLCEEAKRE